MLGLMQMMWRLARLRFPEEEAVTPPWAFSGPWCCCLACREFRELFERVELEGELR